MLKYICLKVNLLKFNSILQYYIVNSFKIYIYIYLNIFFLSYESYCQYVIIIFYALKINY